MDVFGVEAITAIVPDGELSEEWAVGVHSVKVIVQTSKLFNFLNLGSAWVP